MNFKLQSCLYVRSIEALLQIQHGPTRRNESCKNFQPTINMFLNFSQGAKSNPQESDEEVQIVSITIDEK